MAIKPNTEISDIGKQFLPEGLALATDRGKKAPVVPLEEWKGKHNRTDLQGYDTPDAKERSKISVIKDLKGIRGHTTSGEDAMIEEPERFLKYYNQQLTKEELSKIIDFQSFKEATRKVFQKDPSLPTLWENIHGREAGLKEVFKTDAVQQWINQNSESFVIDYIMAKKNVGRLKAQSSYNRLSLKQKNRLISKVIRGVPIKIRARQERIPRIKLITQIRDGKPYQRTKPVRWTDMQENFVRNNKSRGLKWVTDYYNNIFPDARTKRSVQNKFYRVRKV